MNAIPLHYFKIKTLKIKKEKPQNNFLLNYYMN